MNTILEMLADRGVFCVDIIDDNRLLIQDSDLYNKNAKTHPQVKGKGFLYNFRRNMKQLAKQYDLKYQEPIL